MPGEDAARAHALALAKAPDLGFDIFIVSTTPPFAPADVPAVVDRYFPD